MWLRINHLAGYPYAVGPPTSQAMKALLLFVALALSALVATPAASQTRSVRDTATAYGARLDAKGRPANTNTNRINSRIDSRINSRLALRIERYRPDSTDNPTAAFQATQDDKSRAAPVIAPPQSQDNAQ
jgi:hypothetical protein